ncbi:MAG: homocysteine S-methyltransferase family protein, partial [Ruminococcus sp.]|nr:homocysteine S-methyltransferase family protein [Ruminococcus sp.]
MDFRKFLQDNIVILDGGMGTLLQERGLQPGEAPERWNTTHPEEVTAIHKAYYDSGSNVVNTNTFGANLMHFTEDELEDVICSAIKNALNAAEQSNSAQDKFVALDIGPTGR